MGHRAMEDGSCETSSFNSATLEELEEGLTEEEKQELEPEDDLQQRCRDLSIADKHIWDELTDVRMREDELLKQIHKMKQEPEFNETDALKYVELFTEKERLVAKNRELTRKNYELRKDHDQQKATIATLTNSTKVNQQTPTRKQNSAKKKTPKTEAEWKIGDKVVVMTGINAGKVGEITGIREKTVSIRTENGETIPWVKNTQI